MVYHLYIIMAIIADIMLTVVSISFGFILQSKVFNPDNMLSISPYFVTVVIARPLFLYCGGVYHRVWRYATSGDFARFVILILAGSIFAFFCTIVFFVPKFMSSLPVSFYVLEAMVSVLLLGGSRIMVKAFQHYPGDINWKKTCIDRGKKVLIVGAGDSGTILAGKLKKNPYLGLQPVAFLDDDPKKIGMKIQGLRVCGPLIKLGDVIHKEKIEEVIISIPSAPDQTIKNVQHACRVAALPFRTVPPLSSFIEDISGLDDSTGSSLQLPMSLPDITSAEIKAVVRVMQSRNLSIGAQTLKFEELIAAEANAKFAIAVTNGTSALHLCVIAAGIGMGDEVITTPFSFISSANCILFEKAKPVFVDIDPISLNINPAKIEASITKRTKAILVVHVFGQPADMDPILEIAGKHGLIVIEDACEAIGAEYMKKRVGALGKAGAFAFYPNKQMTTGEGAALVTNDEEWANLFKSLRNQGRDKFDGWLNHSRLGYNYRISELHATVGVVQLRRLNELLNKRNAVAEAYNRVLLSVPQVSPLKVVPTTTRMSWFVYTVRLPSSIKRNEVIDAMAAKGIPTRPYFTPIHLQPFYVKRFGFRQGDFPESEAAGGSTIALPFHTNMKTEEIEVVCRALKEVVSENSGRTT